MIYKIFTVYDSKAEAYLQPFYYASKGQAIRVFTDLVSDKSHAFGKHPEDYILFELGEWDDSKASFNDIPPRSIGVGVDFLKSS